VHSRSDRLCFSFHEVKIKRVFSTQLWMRTLLTTCDCLGMLGDELLDDKNHSKVSMKNIPVVMSVAPINDTAIVDRLVNMIATNNKTTH
jgi:hypothetical protein